VSLIFAHSKRLKHSVWWQIRQPNYKHGPNAAGKSNLLLALRFMKDFVLSSAVQSGEKIKITPFLFHQQTQISEFEIIYQKSDTLSIWLCGDG